MVKNNIFYSLIKRIMQKIFQKCSFPEICFVLCGKTYITTSVSSLSENVTGTNRKFCTDADMYILQALMSSKNLSKKNSLWC